MKKTIFISFMAMILLFSFVVTAYAVPFHPDIIKQLKEEGKEDIIKDTNTHLAELARTAKTRGMNRNLTTGDNKVLVILMNYTDYTFDSNESTPTFYKNLFEQGPNSDGFGWTQYYQQMSNDVLNLSFDVVGPYDANNNRIYYRTHDDSGYAIYGNTKELIEEAVAAADPDVDFSNYDNDNDGYVDGLVVIHQGQGRENTGNNTLIHSHMSSIYESTNDGVSVYTYSCQPEYNDSPGDSTIGVFVHEYGHVLGLPDLYDTQYSGTDGVGKWSVMAGGSWAGDGARPVPMLAWEKDQLGWIVTTHPIINNFTEIF